MTGVQTCALPISEESIEHGAEGIEQKKEIKKNFIYICDGDGNNQRRLTEGTNPVVSPDGKWVAFRRIRLNEKYGNIKELWIIGIDGKGKKLLAGDKNISWYTDAWSPNGEWITTKITEYDFENGRKILKHKIGIVSLNGNKIIIDKKGSIYGFSSWSSKSDLFTFMKYISEGNQRINYKYNLKDNRLEEFEELNKKHTMRGIWSLKNLIYAYGGKEIPLALLYFSDKYEVISEKVLLGDKKEEQLDSIRFYWSKDGEKLIYRTNKNMTYIYSIKENKNIWQESALYLYSSDFKWAYFKHIGKLSKFSGLYRISTPKRLQDIIDRGK